MKQNTNVQKHKNIKELLISCGERFGDSTAFIIKVGSPKSREYTKKSFNALIDDVVALGTALFSMGFKGKRIAISGRNSYAWAVSFMACMWGGIVAVPIDKELEEGELEDSLARSGACALIYDSKYEYRVKRIEQNGRTSIETYISMGEGDLTFDVLLQKGRELVEGADTSFKDFDADPDVMSVLLFTSGTTARSKAVMLHQRGFVLNVYDTHRTEDLRFGDVNIALLPFHHVFGSISILLMLDCGVATAFADGLKYLKQNFAEYKVSVFLAVPLIIEAIRTSVEREIKKQNKEKLFNVMRSVSRFLRKCKIDVRRKLFASVLKGLGGEMRFLISGAAPLNSDTALFFDDIGINIVQGYGLTETSPVIAAEGMFSKRRGSVGKPIKSLEVVIADKDLDGIGEITVKGDTVMLGYYENDEATREVLSSDGWFRTGDLGYMDSDGYLFVTGRKKDMIVLKNGKKIFPEEIESLVNRIEGVSESFVYGVNEDGGISYDKIHCKAVYDKSAFSGKSETEIYDAIWQSIKEVNKTLPIYKYVKGLTITDEPLIKTTTNKIKRKEELKRIV